MLKVSKKKEVKNDNDEYLILPPDPERVMEGLRDTGYNFNTAVADIIDNSIAADADIIDIRIEINPLNEMTIYITDNGTGMDASGLENAMRYGSRQRDNAASLGKFGLGLKTGSTAFCRCLSVISRGNGDPEVRKVQWDLDYIASNNEWKLKKLRPTEDEVDILNEVAQDGTGTVVVWEKIDRLLKQYKRKSDQKKALKKLIDSLQFHISMVYQRFLDKTDKRERNIIISLNDKEVEAWDPFCTKEKDTEILANDSVEVEIDEKRASSFQLKAYLLPRRESFSSPEAMKKAKLSNEMQGFYIYRENRLIHCGDWMGMFAKEPHFSLLRVEFSFDHTLDEVFNVDIKKSRILLNEEIFSFIQSEFIPAPRRAAEERYRKGTRKEVADKGKNAHEASNKSIDSKAPLIEESKTAVTGKDEVELTNHNGVFTHKIVVRSAAKGGEYRVVPVQNIEDGQLWQPCIIDGKHAVEINQSHPYYQKIYYPVLQQSVMVTGMDSLLWALSEAELATINEDTKEQYEDMRIQVSRFLKKLIADLPDPEPEDEE